MGQFSWFTQDTKTQIFNDWDRYGDQQTIHMVDPRDGHDYKEEAYEGYGVFGGRDFYELLADINKDLIEKYSNSSKENIEVLNKKFEDLTPDDIDIKRIFGIDLWFSYIEPEGEISKMLPLQDNEKWYTPILVEDYYQWSLYSNPFNYPESDPDQGWHLQEDEDEEEL